MAAVWAIRLAVTMPALLAGGVMAFAQQPPIPPPPNVPNPSTGANLLRGGGLLDFFTSRTPYEFWLTCVIVFFGLAVILLLVWNVRGVRDRRVDDVARSVIVVTVIVGALILVTAGYSNDQIAPAFGLFGTIVGYILGRMSRIDAERRSDDVSPEPVQAPREPANPP